MARAFFFLSVLSANALAGIGEASFDALIHCYIGLRSTHALEDRNSLAAEYLGKRYLVRWDSSDMFQPKPIRFLILEEEGLSLHTFPAFSEDKKLTRRIVSLEHTKDFVPAFFLTKLNVSGYRAFYVHPYNIKKAAEINRPALGIDPETDRSPDYGDSKQSLDHLRKYVSWAITKAKRNSRDSGQWEAIYSCERL